MPTACGGGLGAAALCLQPERSNVKRARGIRRRERLVVVFKVHGERGERDENTRIMALSKNTNGPKSSRQPCARAKKRFSETLEFLMHRELYGFRKLVNGPDAASERFS